MNGAKPANPPDQPVLPLSSEDGKSGGTGVGPGMSTLLQGQRPKEAATLPNAPRPETTPPASPSTSAGLQWTLLAADLVLVILAVWLMTGGAGPPGVAGIALGIVAISLGAWLGCYAFLHGK